MTDGTTLPSAPCTQSSMCLHTRVRPSVWCNLNLDPSMKIQCRQLRMFQTLLSLAHWRQRRRSLMGSCQYARKYSTARRRCVMVRTDRRHTVWRIRWALYLGLDRNLLAWIIHNKYRSPHSKEIRWRWERCLWLGDPVCHVHFKILLMAPRVNE